MSNDESARSGRIASLDLLRGTAVILMVLYHTVYSFGMYYKLAFFSTLFSALRDVAPAFISTMFITVCAVSAYLSGSNIRRGLKTLAIAGGITIGTVIILPALGMDGLEIRFGVLHFLGCAMILSPLLIKLVKKTPSHIGITVSSFLFLFTMKISDGWLGIPGFLAIAVPQYLKDIGWLFPIGIISENFYSSDYYAILPWIFIYTIGLWLGKSVFKNEIPETAYRSIVRPIETVGKKSLLIYLAHTPVIYLIGYILTLFLKK